MKRKLLTAIHLLMLMITLSTYAQQQPEPGTKEYTEQKAKGLLSPAQPAAKRQKNYPVLLDATTRNNASTKMAISARQASQSIAASGCPIIDPRIEGGYTQIPVQDDNSIGPIALPFTFNLFGKNYTSIYVNNNGNISFNARNATYTPDGFPLAGVDMVAPFWADVDTRGSGGVYYKAEATRFTIVWYRVGYYDSKTDKVNTFKLIITNGADATIGAGNNVAFMYGDMQWTAGQLTDDDDNPGLGGSPATVGLNSGVGANSCFYFQLGRFYKRGTEYIDPFVPGGVDYLDDKCFFFDASTIEDVKFDFTYTPLLCAIDFRSLINNPQNCRIESFMWDFGDGSTSTDQNPIHSYSAPGTYTVSITGSYACGACGSSTATTKKQVVIRSGVDPMVDSLIYLNTDTRQQILSASVTTFSDAWPMQQQIPSLNATHGFVNGTQGVWRNEGSHVYDVARKQSTPPDLAHDGTFSMDQFSWENADLGAIPNWIKASTVTGYSSYSYEVENQDVLGIYSSALYDYGGHLPSANGVNMRHAEMAFTGFEFLDGNSTGNWVFGTQPLPQTYIYPTLISYRNIAVVKASPAELANIQKVDVTARSLLFFFFSRRTATVLDDEIICVRSHPENPNWSLVVLRTPPLPGLWTGEIKVNNQIVPTVNAVIDQNVAHTGKSSLRIATATTFKQDLIRLDSGKAYMISAWVSINNPGVLTPSLGNGLGIDITLKNAQNTTRGTFNFKPTGRIIEGWQQVKGVFVCPDWALRMEVKFNPVASGTAWYDDLRLHPEKGNMSSYVYDLKDYRLRAILDEENFASMFFYDQEGNLYLTQKETEEGIKTINENVSYQVERN